MGSSCDSRSEAAPCVRERENGTMVNSECVYGMKNGAKVKRIFADSDIFPGFFHVDLQGNVLPKLELLRQFGFYPSPQEEQKTAEANAESCGAHSPHTGPPVADGYGREP
jgi:hypothetical protein